MALPKGQLSLPNRQKAGHSHLEVANSNLKYLILFSSGMIRLDNGPFF